jgi:dynein heavy chain
MYLEGIFVGGDIRAQLPEEAKKFDIIDKLFKKVLLKNKSNKINSTLLNIYLIYLRS